ncbi:MAG: prepilin-type cleavage/methylation domain-containing protein [Burkholderiales bacterium]|nr:prepilin-type cleavage/methylation domain-containing protein [Burkholderiales bacterium]
MCTRKHARGLTLVELIIFIVVVSAAVAGVLAVFTQATRASSDPLIRKQAIAVAESLLEEILAVPYTCPSGASCVAVTTANRGATHAVADYNGFAMTGIAAFDGTPIPQLANYTASVTVTPQPLNGANGSRITITVASGGETVTLEGWRGNY